MESEVKVIEIRDRMTFIPALAIKIVTNDTCPIDAKDEAYGLRRVGFTHGIPYFFFSPLNREFIRHVPWEWNDRTFSTAHQYVASNWDSIKSGDVVDVEYILGETNEPKRSERLDEVRW